MTEDDYSIPPPSNLDNVRTLPNAPPRTLEGRLLSELTDTEIQVEIMRRRLRGLPPLPGTEEVMRERGWV